MFCVNCGKKIPDDSVYCPECGKQATQSVNDTTNISNNKSMQTDNTIEKRDVIMAIVCYITWVGFIVAVVSGGKSSTFIRFHLNQGLIINIVATSTIIFPYIISIPLLIVSFVFCIMGIVYASNRSIEPLPLIGSIKLI